MQQRKTRLDNLVEKAALTARNEGRSVLVSACEQIAAVDPLALLESIDYALMPERMFWSEPREALAFAAAGAVYTFEHSGPGRFSETDRELNDVLEARHGRDSEARACSSRPRLLRRATSNRG